MIVPEIFIVLGICMLLLMSLSEHSQKSTTLNPAKKSFSSIFKAQINAVHTWFECGVPPKSDT